MLAWELKLRVRRCAVEGRMAFYRDRHGDLAVERARCPFKGASWKTKSEKMALLKMLIHRELAEIEHIRMMANCGPIVGNRMVLHVRDGMTHKVRPGPSIKDLIERQMKESKTSGYDEGWNDAIDTALRVLFEPYKFLDPDEKASYDTAEADADKIISTRATGGKEGQTIKTASNLDAARATGNVVTRKG
jgi:hypothetical protein